MPETEPHSPEAHESLEAKHQKAKQLALLNQLIQEMWEVARSDRPGAVSDVASDVLAEYCKTVVHEDPEQGRLLVDALESPEGSRDWDLDLADQLRDELGMPPVDRSVEASRQPDPPEHEV